jgi:hypothetical protein
MGLDLASIQLLCCAKNTGVDFTEALMIGRQEILCGPKEARRALSTAGIAEDCAQDIGRGHVLCVSLKETEIGIEFPILLKLVGAPSLSTMSGLTYARSPSVSRTRPYSRPIRINPTIQNRGNERKRLSSSGQRPHPVKVFFAAPFLDL